MDSSNLAHFVFSFLVPIGWAMILIPFTQHFRQSWAAFLFLMLTLSLAIIFAKELIDIDPSINDIAGDCLGFFLGVAVVSDRYLRRARAIRRAEERDVSGHRISLRSTLFLMESIERRSSDFFLRAALFFPGAKAAKLCLLLSRDAKRRADRVRFTLSGWKSRGGAEQISEATERAFSSNHLFSLALPRNSTPAEILRIAVDHENKKLSIFARLEEAFQEEWKIMHLERVLSQLSSDVKKLEFCLAEIEKENRGKPG